MLYLYVILITYVILTVVSFISLAMNHPTSAQNILNNVISMSPFYHFAARVG